MTASGIGQCGRRAGSDPSSLTAVRRPQVVRSVAGQYLHGGDQLGVGVHHNRRLVPVEPPAAALVPVARLRVVDRHHPVPTHPVPDIAGFEDRDLRPLEDAPTVCWSRPEVIASASGLLFAFYKYLAEKPDWGGNRDDDSHSFRPHRAIEGKRPAESARAVIPFESRRDVASMKGIE